jgi:hypothetical protein
MIESFQVTSNRLGAKGSKSKECFTRCSTRSASAQVYDSSLGFTKLSHKLLSQPNSRIGH